MAPENHQQCHGFVRHRTVTPPKKLELWHQIHSTYFNLIYHLACHPRIKCSWVPLVVSSSSARGLAACAPVKTARQSISATRRAANTIVRYSERQRTNKDSRHYRQQMAPPWATDSMAPDPNWLRCKWMTSKYFQGPTTKGLVNGVCIRLHPPKVQINHTSEILRAFTQIPINPYQPYLPILPWETPGCPENQAGQFILISFFPDQQVWNTWQTSCKGQSCSIQSLEIH